MKRHRFRAQQAEAKLNLAHAFVLQKAFYSSYSAFIPDWVAIGFDVEGENQYSYLACENGPYRGSVKGYAAQEKKAEIPRRVTTLDWRKDAKATCPIDLRCDTFYPAADPQDFIHGAKAQLCEDCETDFWTIDSSNRLQSCVAGLPD